MPPNSLLRGGKVEKLGTYEKKTWEKTEGIEAVQQSKIGRKCKIQPTKDASEFIPRWLGWGLKGCVKKKC